MEQPHRVFVANGELHARQVCAFLESAGIETAARGEALRHTHGLTLDGLGGVAILVAKADVEQALSLLASADAGDFRLADDAVSDEGEKPPPDAAVR